jgi:hypothetical protein
MFKFTLACLASLVAAEMTELDWEYDLGEWGGQNYFGDNWTALNAYTKFTEIWEACSVDETSREYDFHVYDFLAEDMGPSINSAHEEISGRSKAAHQRGVVAQVRYESTGDHDYTGLFDGWDLGIMRLSDSGFIIDGDDSCNPSAAIKVFIDGGLATRNMMFAISFPNTSGLDFFPKDDTGSVIPLTNHPVPIPENDTCERETQAAKLAQATSSVFSTGHKEYAAVNQDGSWVGEANMLFPWEVALEANFDVIPTYEEGTDPLDYLKSIPASGGDHLFTVKAMYNPNPEDYDLQAKKFGFAANLEGEDMSQFELQTIGYIYSDSAFIGSAFADETLHFKHMGFGDDVFHLADYDIDRKRLFKQVMDVRHGDIEVFDDDILIEMPTYMDDQDTVELGIAGEFPGAEGLTCPFAWVLAADL